MKIDKLSIIEELKKSVEGHLIEQMKVFGRSSRLQEACQYSLLNGGKRFRAIIVHLMGKALGCKWNLKFAALATEYLHTASLIADDLPCMDNTEERRSKPTTHKVFGEDIALLSSYALIAEGYACLNKTLSDMQPHVPLSKGHHMVSMALESVTKNTGVEGATGGQFIDLYPEVLSEDFLKEVIKKKTVSLFEISFVLGWIFAGGAFNLLPEIKKLSCCFGLAFQIADDFDDLQQDMDAGCVANYVLTFGEENAYKTFKEQVGLYREMIEKLNLETSFMQLIIGAVEKKFEQQLNKKTCKTPYI